METQTIKVWKSTLKQLRMIYALTGERMVSILERLVADELKRVRNAQGTQDQAESNS